jgi:type I restriction enzyme, S subunit
MKTEIPKGWKRNIVDKLIFENPKSKIQVNQANNTGRYKFFTSGEAILRFDDFLIDGENIFLATGGVANINYYKGKCSYSTDTYTLKSNIETKFLYYLLAQKIQFINYKLFEGTGLKHLQKKEFKDLKILFPESKEEQKKIVEILEIVDNTIEKTKELIEKNKKMKDGLMLDLFFKPNYDVGKLGDLAKLQGGFAFSSHDSSEYGIKWLKIANVSFEKIIWKEISFLPYPYLDNYSNFALKIDDLVIAMTRPLIRDKLKIAKIKKKDVPSLLNQRVGKLNLTNDSDKEYIYYVLQTKQAVKQIDLAILGTDPPNISGNQIESINIPIPDRNKRIEISEILLKIDNKIKSEEETLFKLQKIKAGLMQDLLTGNKAERIQKLIKYEVLA